eukprot:4383894-Amphidinium_carterae.1
MELDQARRQHHLQSSSLRNELQTARTEAGNPSQGAPHHELEESRVHRDRLRLELTQAQTQPVCIPPDSQQYVITTHHSAELKRRKQVFERCRCW